MFNYQRLFHTGMSVHDLASAMDAHGRALNLTWAEPFTFESLPFWTPSRGLEQLRVEATYSREGPHRLELVVGPKGSFYDPDLDRGFHVGCWVDDVAAEVEQMQRQGWRVVGAGGLPEDGWGPIAYLEPSGGGLRVELVTIALQANFERWWAGEPLG